MNIFLYLRTGGKNELSTNSIMILVRFVFLLFERLVREVVFDFPSLSACQYWSLQNKIKFKSIAGIMLKKYQIKKLIFNGL